MSAKPMRTIASVNWQPSWPKPFPALASNMLPTAVPTNAATASTATRFGGRFPVFNRNGQLARALRNSTMRIARWA